MRIVQQKTKGDGIYINLSRKKHGLQPNDAVQVEVMSNGILILKKMVAKQIKDDNVKDSVIHQILESIGLKKHIDTDLQLGDYEFLEDAEEINSNSDLNKIKQ